MVDEYKINDSPNINDNPSLFPAQAKVMWQRLYDNINTDHTMDVTAGDNEGFHNLIHMIPESADPAVDTTIGQIYTKNDSGKINLYYRNNVTGSVPIVLNNIAAWCNFNGASSTPITPRNSFNVANVTRISSGVFVINFTNALTLEYYAVSGSAGAVNVRTLCCDSTSKTSCTVEVREAEGVRVNDSNISVMCVGY